MYLKWGYEYQTKVSVLITYIFKIFYHQEFCKFNTKHPFTLSLTVSFLTQKHSVFKWCQPELCLPHIKTTKCHVTQIYLKLFYPGMRQRVVSRTIINQLKIHKTQQNEIEFLCVSVWWSGGCSLCELSWFQF